MMLQVLQQLSELRTKWACEIVPGLFLGSGAHAANLTDIQHHGVTRIPNVADDVENFHESCTGIVYENLGVCDFNQDIGICRVFPKAFAFLRKAENEGQPVLVHCAAGANRSATIVIAWLMFSNAMTLLDAWEMVKRVKRGVCPMIDNRKQLLDFERQLYHGISSFSSDEDFLTRR